MKTKHHASAASAFPASPAKIQRINKIVMTREIFNALPAVDSCSDAGKMHLCKCKIGGRWHAVSRESQCEDVVWARPIEIRLLIHVD